jgi:hypothetical protein
MGKNGGFFSGNPVILRYPDINGCQRTGKSGEKKSVSIICIWQEETASRSRVSAGSECVSGECCILKNTPIFFLKPPCIVW